MGILTAGTDTMSVTVLNTSTLTNPNASVYHYPIGGGLPAVTLRTSTGLSGSLEFLCADAETADRVYAAHLDGQVLHLDDWKRRNLATYWRDPAGVDPGQPGTASVVTTGGPVGMGWWQFVASGPDSASPFLVDYTAGGLAALPVTAGETYTLSAYLRQDSTDDGTPFMRIGGTYYDAAGAPVSSTPTGTPSTTEGAFVRMARVITIPQGVALFKPVIQFSGSDARPAGTTYYAVGVMLEQGQLGDYFNGSTPDTGAAIHEWQGTPDLSSSVMYERPALDLTYTASGVELPRKVSLNKYLVRVPGFQEVSA